MQGYVTFGQGGGEVVDDLRVVVPKRKQFIVQSQFMKYGVFPFLIRIRRLIS
jgi:hypothetical protein